MGATHGDVPIIVENGESRSRSDSPREQGTRRSQTWFGVPDLWDIQFRPFPQALLIIQIWRERALRRSAVILLLVCSALLAEDRRTHCKDKCLSATEGFAAVCCRLLLFCCYVAAALFDS